MTCQTCYSTVKLLPTTYRTPCCDLPICPNCLARNPRLQEYDPCLRCGDVTSTSGEERIMQGRIRAEQKRKEAERSQFTIGDIDADEEEIERSGNGNASASGSSKGESSPKRHAAGSGDEDVSEYEMQVVEITHPVGRNDSLLQIARKYAVDTRRILVISRRKVPRSQIPDPLLFDATDEGLDDEEAAKREAERRVKRFQLITKQVDPGVGKVYLGLAEMDQDKHPLELGSGEAILDKELGSGKKVQSGGVEGRAIDRYWEDDEWEREVGRPQRVKVDGRWTVVGSGRGPFMIKS